MMTFGINQHLVLRDDKDAEHIVKMHFNMYKSVTQELSYLVYEGKFNLEDIKKTTPYERGLHLKYVSDRIKAYNDAMSKSMSKK